MNRESTLFLQQEKKHAMKVNETDVKGDGRLK